MNRDSKEKLIQELENNNALLSIKALGEYKRNGVVVRIQKANTGFMFDRELVLWDGTIVVAWI